MLAVNARPTDAKLDATSKLRIIVIYGGGGAYNMVGAASPAKNAFQRPGRIFISVTRLRNDILISNAPYLKKFPGAT